MSVQLVAVVFDDTARPETTGVYCRRALAEMVDVEHFLPTELDRLPRDRFDLVLFVDDGLRYPIPVGLGAVPTAYWAIDTHLDLEWACERGRQVDLLFAAQRDGAELLRQRGFSTASWLPLACDPEVHRPHKLPKTWDFSFVGNLTAGPRRELIHLLQERFPNSFVGQRYFDEMAETFSQSRIVFNRSILNDVNMRVFEGAACGSLLVTNDLSENGQPELFRDGVHLAAYRDPEELIDKVWFYLRHEPLREQIAAAGRAEAVARHTYAHRMRTILEAVDNRQQRTTVAAAQSAPEAKPESSKNIRPQKDWSYFDFARPEVVALVPRTARKILDIGCSAGRLGASIKERQSAEVVGIELNPEAAAVAHRRLDRVVEGSVETEEVDFPEGTFDCIVCADVLEHLREPAAVLKKIRRWLTSEGTLVASIPNVRHHTVVRALLDGNWTYESAGLLDDDHVRFFTRRETEKLLFRAGYELQSLTFVPGEGFSEWEQASKPATIELGGLQIRSRSAEEAAEWFAYQYLVTARPNPAPVPKRTSIVLVTHNELDYTRLCLDSLRQRTDESIELTVVDNGSTDGTADYLRSRGDVQLIANADNRGFPAAANQGIRASRGENILLLNNDTIVTTGWLRRMLDLLEREPEVGLVGPCSNRCSGPQEIAVGYDRLESLDGFAWDWGKTHDRQTVPTDRLVGFCLLFRREVVDQIGHLDERFGIGNFEDDDFCRRAIDAGFQAKIAVDSFVHHFGSRTFAGSGVNFAGLLEENRQKYEAKWNGNRQSSNGHFAESQPAPVTTAPEPPPSTPHSELRIPHFPTPPRFSIKSSPQGGLLLVPKSVKLSLCMIVRDNESTIGPCLQSIRPYVDEIVVVDTGSKDRTPKICREYGARLYEFPWCDDFSAARNESLKYARGEWLFWMDSDDTIPAECGEKLRALADGPHAENIFGYVMQVHCPGPGDGGHLDVTVVDHVKLIRNRPDLRFEGRIHEQLLPAIRRAEGEVAWTDLYVVHSGSDHSPEGWQRKLERDLRILHRELAEQPEHPFVLFNLGMTYADAKRYDEAIAYFERCLKVSVPAESHLRKAYALYCSSLSQVDRHEEAWKACQAGRALYPDDKELLFREAMLHSHFGRLRDAEQSYLEVLNGHEDRHFTSIVRGLTTEKARNNLALVYEEMGCLDKAEAEWRQIILDEPENISGWRGLGEILIRRNDFSGVEKELALLLLKKGSLYREGLFLRGRLASARGDAQAALNDFEKADQLDSAELEPLRFICQHQFQRNDLVAAERSLRRLTERAPNDAAALHNLGTLHARQLRPQEAIGYYRRSLALRPEAIDTWLQLGWSLRDAGRAGESVQAFRELLRRNPHHAVARAELLNFEGALVDT